VLVVVARSDNNMQFVKASGNSGLVDRIVDSGIRTGHVSVAQDQQPARSEDCASSPITRSKKPVAPAKAGVAPGQDFNRRHESTLLSFP